MAHENSQTVGEEWVSFPGGELEGKRPKVLCPACREALNREAAGEKQGSASRVSKASGLFGPSTRLSGLSSPSRPLCFQCYRANLDRERAIRDAGRLDTASEERFQSQLPLEPVDKPRLEMLKVDRAREREAAVIGVGRFTDKRRQAQIAARHALQTIAEGLRARRVATSGASTPSGAGTTAADRELAMAIHAAELQLPDAWLPFVVSR
jgi:hypothetical protein